MRNSTPPDWTCGDLAARWHYHPSTIPRVMRRFGFSGRKFGASRQAARRYTDAEVTTVEALIARAS